MQFLAAMARVLQNRFFECFNDVDFDDDDYDDLVERLKEPDQAKDVKKEVLTIKANLRKANIIEEAYTEDHFEALNTAFENFFPDTMATYQSFGDTKNQSHSIAMAGYRESAAEGLEKVTNDLETKGKLTALDKEDILAMKQAPAKMRLLMDPQFSSPLKDFVHIPFFTRSCYVIMKKKFKAVEDSITEVSRVYTFAHFFHVPKCAMLIF